MRRFLWLLIFFVSVAPLFADPIDIRLIRSISTDVPVQQVTTTADGQRIYALMKDGTIRLYGQDGQPQGFFDVGPDVIRIVPQGVNRLILQTKDQQQILLMAVVQKVRIATQGAPIQGQPDAPVTIAIFDDFECPYCSKVVPVIKDVLKAYPEQVKLVFKNFPLAIHKYSRAAAIAGLAAQQQGKFWLLYDLMFANYRQLNPAKIQELAQQVGLDMARFDKDLVDPELTRRIDADIREGKRIGVRGTPTLFINGRHVQQRSVAAMSLMIEAELVHLGKKSGQ